MQRYGNLPPYNLAKIASAQEILTRITQLPIPSSILPLISIRRKFKMPGTNWRVPHGMGQIHGQAVAMEGGDWRTQLPPCSRHRVVYKIMETLRSLYSPAGQEYLQDPEVTAVGFEENIFTAATSQSDYLRKISLKLLALEKKPQYPMVNSFQSNAASNSRNSQDPVMAAGMDGSDWKIRLHPESRQRIVNKIVEMLRRYLPFSELEGEGLQVLIDMAARFEENVYTAARTQTEYLRKISLKMLTLAREGRNPTTNSFPSIVLSAGDSHVPYTS